MLEYTKIILSKVSFDSWLFEKELKKSISYLMPHEIDELFHFVKINHAQYAELLDKLSSLL